MKPFRWDLSRREQLGSLVAGPGMRTFAGYADELEDCCAKIVARSEGRGLVFVGRSPENFFDYLSGVFQGTSFESRVHLLQLSNRFENQATLRREQPGAIEGLREYFRAMELSPADIIGSEGVAFADLVYSGGTFEYLYEFLEQWCEESGLSSKQLAMKVSIVGVTERTKNSPNTWRWQQHAPWLKGKPGLVVRNVSVSRELWNLLGNYQQKTTMPYGPSSWRTGSARPPLDTDTLQALSHAYALYQQGVAQKRRFAARLSGLPEMRYSGVRTLVNQLRLNT